MFEFGVRRGQAQWHGDATGSPDAPLDSSVLKARRDEKGDSLFT